MPPDANWHQFSIKFTDRATAVHVTAHQLTPALNHAQDAGLLRTWWYIRKPPGVRLRYQPAEPDILVVDRLLDGLAAGGHVTSWTRGIYEPETIAFGGPAAMDIAHTLFHHDSRHLLARAAQTDTASAGMGQRETTVLLISTMLRAAGLDWFEQGDVWAKVADLRPSSQVHRSAAERAEELGRAVRRLMSVDARSVPDLLAEPWLAAFETAGQQLAALDRHGQMHRGLRGVLAHHFIFHANRVGLPGEDQATLAALAVDTVFTTPLHRPASAGANTDTSKVSPVTTTVSDASAASADELRAKLADRLVKDNTVSTPAVEAAFRQVPRDLFLPGIPLGEAYADEPIYTKHDGTGAGISAASQPTIVATMLEQLQIQPGQKILELGAGTGYNAALMATITGDTGHVTTIDIDDDLVDNARKHLAAASIAGVDVVLADGALGHGETAPFDRVIATVGAFEIPTPWLEQLAPGGRLVVPVRLAGAASRSIIFERDAEGWVSHGSEMCTFMPLRGIGDDARRVIDLTGTGEVTLQSHQDNAHATDPDALAGVFATFRHETWTGVHFVPMESFEWLDLWLACRLPNPIMRMEVAPTAKDSGLVKPMFPTVAMATTTVDGSLAYLTIRAAEPSPEGDKRYEVGVIGHGPGGQELAEQVAHEITAWDKGFRTRTVHFGIPDRRPEPDINAGRLVLNRPNNPMTVTWE
jgi:protein-L-isoaspartate(D-aspartate) O-methyltransferase